MNDWGVVEGMFAGERNKFETEGLKWTLFTAEGCELLGVEVGKMWWFCGIILPVSKFRGREA